MNKNNTNQKTELDDPLGLAVSRKNSQIKTANSPQPQTNKTKPEIQHNSKNPEKVEDNPKKNEEPPKASNQEPSQQKPNPELQNSNIKTPSENFEDEFDENPFISNTYWNENVDYDDYNQEDGEEVDEDQMRKRQKTYGSFYQSERNEAEDEDEPEPEEKVKERLEKQNFLKSEIINNLFRTKEFESYLESTKKNGGDIGKVPKGIGGLICR